MRKQLALIAVLALLIPAVSFADDPLCEGIAPIVIDREMGDDATTIQEVFDNYATYLDATSDTYRLCFEFVGFESTGGASRTTSLLTFTPADTGKDVVISGLRVTRHPDATFTGPLLTISNRHKVTVSNSNLSNCTNCLQLQNSGPHEIKDSEISCAAGGKGIETLAVGAVIDSVSVTGCNVGVKVSGRNTTVNNVDVASSSQQGMLIYGSGTTVKGSRIHGGAGDGIKIYANDVLLGAADAEHYAIDKNEIYQNRIGIHHVKGARNKWAYNSVYENVVDPTAVGLPDDGILMDAWLVSQLGRPSISFVEGGDGTDDALHCERTEGSADIASRWLQFSVPSAGEITIYETLDAVRWQGRTYLAQCSVGADGRCSFEFPASTSLGDDVCGTNTRAVAVFTSSYSTAYTETFKLNGPLPTFSTIQIIAAPEPTTLPGTAGMTGSDGQMGGSAFIGDDQSTQTGVINIDDVAVREGELESSDPTAGVDPTFDPAAPHGQRSGNTTTAALVGASGSNSKGPSCGASLLGNNASDHQSAVWLFSLVIGVLLLSRRRCR